MLKTISKTAGKAATAGGKGGAGGGGAAKDGGNGGAVPDAGVALQATATSPWDINFEEAQERIRARRKRISNRSEAAKKLQTLIKVQSMFGGGSLQQQIDAKKSHVEKQCDRSRRVIDEVLANGNELVGNVRLAAHHIHVGHRERIEKRDQALEQLLAKEDKETQLEYATIQANWPTEEEKKTAPTELFAKILKQKAACNDLLEKKNELIATLEEEVKESDNEYKALIDDYHENIAVISSRMEYQIQALESLVNSERLEVERAYERQRREELDSTAALWNEKLDGIDAESERQMDHRLQLLLDNEEELDRMIREDGEDFVDMKHGLEDSISVLSDQIQFTEAIHQLNEERLDYEIHVLRKREEEIVLVKSEQKRKITSLQDGINKLRGKVSESHKRIAKEEGQLQAEIADMRKQIHKLEAMRKSSSAHFEKQKREIFEMVKEEVYEDLMDMVEKDYVLQRAVRDPKDVQRVQLYLDPLLAASSSKRKVPPSAELKQSSSRTEKRTSVTPAGAAAGPASALLASSVKTDSNMKELLSALVHEANFLVEENLSILVDDIDEDERNLFKLDSILAAIGMEGEEEVLSILRRLAAGGGGSSNSWARGEILKTIRQHVEAQQRKKAAVPTAATTVASKKISSSSAAGAAAAGGGGGGKVWDEGEEEIQEWNAMIASIGQLMNSDRQQMARELEQRAKNRKKVEALQEENQRMEVKIREMTNIYESITGEKLVPEQELLEL